MTSSTAWFDGGYLTLLWLDVGTARAIGMDLHQQARKTEELIKNMDDE